MFAMERCIRVSSVFLGYDPCAPSCLRPPEPGLSPCVPPTRGGNRGENESHAHITTHSGDYLLGSPMNIFQPSTSRDGGLLLRPMHC